MPDTIDRSASAGQRTLARKLLAATTELLAVARELESTEPGAAGEQTGKSVFKFDGTAGSFAEVARQAYHARRLRNSFFDDDLFGEPAWDILLDLFVAAHERRAESITSLCIASGVPSTTALRYISALEEQGLLTRENDPGDQRRTFVRLSAEGYARMLNYLRKTLPSLTAPDWTLPSDREDA